ncbi:MAG TPA: STAS domain-containing protein [Terriglobia bacterium]|nr:STAS domain-containing protein [Terriglobia bacterium]
MFRVTTAESHDPATLKVEGRLCGPWVGELEKTWLRLASEPGHPDVVADLSDVTFIDSRGCALLERMLQQGAELEAHELLPRFIIDEIKSRLAVR